MTITPEQKSALETLLKAQDKPTEEKKIEAKKVKVKGIKNAEYEVIEIKDGYNIHTIKKEPLAQRSYEKERFLIPRNIGDKLRKRIRFLVVFKTSLKEGEKPTAVCLSDKVDINSRLLYTVKTSNTLKKALVSLFQKPFGFGGFGGKKILLLVVIVAVGVLVYFVYTGQLNLGKLIKLS